MLLPFVVRRQQGDREFSDICNDFAIEHEITGNGFRALYQNFLETQVATVGLRMRF